jgi:hypothetical protein
METLGLPRLRRSPKLSRVKPVAQPPARSRSLIAWLALGLLIGVGHVVPAWHFLFVAHHLCAEHGELVDSVATDSDAAAPAERAETSREKAGGFERAAEGEKAANGAAVAVSATGARISSGAGAHSHEHCEVFAVTRAAPALAPAPTPAQWLPAVELSPSEGKAREAHVDIDLLHYAPKLAPPTRAAQA